MPLAPPRTHLARCRPSREPPRHGPILVATANFTARRWRELQLRSAARPLLGEETNKRFCLEDKRGVKICQTVENRQRSRTARWCCPFCSHSSHFARPRQPAGSSQPASATNNILHSCGGLVTVKGSFPARGDVRGATIAAGDRKLPWLIDLRSRPGAPSHVRRRLVGENSPGKTSSAGACCTSIRGRRAGRPSRAAVGGQAFLASGTKVMGEVFRLLRMCRLERPPCLDCATRAITGQFPLLRFLFCRQTRP